MESVARNALRGADILQGRIDELIANAILLGNGDATALLFRDGTDLVANLAKNSLWDTRLDTSKDPPILSTDELLRHSERPDVYGDSDDHYWAHPYPCPLMAARLRISLGEPSSGESHRLCLGDGALRSQPGDGTVLTAYYHALAGVLAVHGLPASASVRLEALAQADMEPPRTGGEGALSWIVQQQPGDGDVEPARFAVGLLRMQDAPMLFVAVVTSADAPDPLAEAKRLLASAAAIGHAELFSSHARWWDAFWSASAIELADKVLEKTWYRHLYFLACVSRPGRAAPGLFAGLVDQTPCWHGDYHLNYNFQQIFWGAYGANHPELAEPYDQTIIGYLPRARWLCRILFGVQGAYFPHLAYYGEPQDPERSRSRNGRQYFHHTWGRTLGLAAFSAQNLWWHYLYTQDRVLLARIYPVLRDVAEFYRSWGRLWPTVSPEHWGLTPGFDRNRTGTFDVTLIRFILGAAIEAGLLLGSDPELAKGWQRYRQSLPPYPLSAGDDPVVVDVEGAPPIEYNIPVPACPVFPGEDVNRDTEAGTRRLFERTMAGLKTNRNNDLVMMSMAKIRLGTADAYHHLRQRILEHTRENGTLSMVPGIHRFNSFGIYTETFGIVMPITELLLQSTGGTLRLFPSWPRKLAASFNGLRAEGALLVSSSCREEKIGETVVTSLVGGRVMLANEWDTVCVRDAAGSSIPFTRDGTERLSFETVAGMSYRIGPG